MMALPRHFLPCAALALILTLLNAFKPLHIDDAAFYRCASQIHHDPLSPYDFEIVWSGRLLPANQLLAPPLLPYWWAAGIALFGEKPFLWKVWLLPISLLLVFSLHALARRCARGLEMPLLCLIVLSPSLLPGLNLMLDVPVLALSLCALTLFLRAADRDSARAALLAGLVAGLAMQTKYTALVMPALMLVYAGLYRRLRLGFLAAAMAAAVFASWEGFVALRHGQSHFLASLVQQDGSLLAKIGPLFRALLNHAGGLAPATALLGLVALGCSGRWLLGAGVVVVLGYGLITVVPQTETTGMTVSALVCRLLGLLLLGTLALVCWRLVAPGRRLRPRQAAGQECPAHATGGLAWARHSCPAASRRRLEWFLLLWLGLEVASYFVLTPFPAARRVLNLLVVVALLTGRLAARTCRRESSRGLAWGVSAGGALLGLLFYTVDFREAAAQQQAAERAAEHVRSGDGGKGWYVGTWGLMFYAERAGLQPVVPDRSALRKGDWLVVPDAPLPHQEIVLAGAPLALSERVVVGDVLPLRTVWGYYSSNLPLEHRHGPRVSLAVYRVTADFTPAAPEKQCQAARRVTAQAPE
jgi:4-amino-4-deoxy-L-arabinose transferase-like glycosyltransferase